MESCPLVVNWKRNAFLILLKRGVSWPGFRGRDTAHCHGYTLLKGKIVVESGVVSLCWDRRKRNILLRSVFKKHPKTMYRSLKRKAIQNPSGLQGWTIVSLLVLTRSTRTPFDGAFSMKFCSDNKWSNKGLERGWNRKNEGGLLFLYIDKVLHTYIVGTDGRSQQFKRIIKRTKWCLIENVLMQKVFCDGSIMWLG